jgi:cobaltochelatase CobS
MASDKPNAANPFEPLINDIVARVKDELQISINAEQLREGLTTILRSEDYNVKEALKEKLTALVTSENRFTTELLNTVSNHIRINYGDLRNLNNDVIDLKGKLANHNSEIATITSDIVKEALKNFKVPGGEKREIVIKDHRVPEAERKDIVISGEHPQFAEVLTAITDKTYPYVYGPTGSGKTFATKKMAELLKVPFYRKVMSSQASESALMGYGQGGGQYVEGIANRAYKDGGLLLIDEIDNGNANINTVIKQLADGDECYFPVVGVVKKHDNFYLVANANTIGNGATRQYVGRAPQDKAMLNTFVYFEWNYDQEFEERIAWNEFVHWGGTARDVFDNMINDFWKMRKATDELSIDHIFSTRNLLQLSKATARGWDIKTITKSIIVRGLDKDQYRKICERANSAGAIIKSRSDIDVFESMEDSLKAKKKGGSPF